MTTDAPRIAIHILGAGSGESVIVEMPGGRWGVVDCCASSSLNPELNETLKFLRSREEVKELEFLCLTHPHEDHYRGMSQILEVYPVRFFWRFDGMSGRHFLRLVEYLQIDAEETDRDEEVEASKEFERIFGLIHQRKAASGDGSPLMKRCGPATELYPVPHDESAKLRVMALAPSGNQVELYEKGLAACFNEDGSLVKERLPRAHHNLVSTALLIMFGETRIILGGDVERKGWEDVVKEIGPSWLSAHLVKVSHHGSTTGYCDGLWARFASNAPPAAVTTAFASQGLPRKAALEHIKDHADPILTTCLSALNDDQVPSWTAPETAKVRLALLLKMGGAMKSVRHSPGRCTLVYDDRGNRLSVEFDQAAGQISPVIKD